MSQQKGLMITVLRRIRINLQRNVTAEIWNIKKGTPAGWIPFRESLIVVLGGSEVISLREGYRSFTTARQIIKKRQFIGSKRPSRPSFVARCTVENAYSTGVPTLCDEVPR